MTPELPTPGLLHELLDHRAACTPDAPAITAAGHTWTYRQLRELTVGAAGWLRRCGVSRGDRVLTLATADPMAVVASYAVSRIGAVHAIVSDATRPFHLAHILTDCDPRLVLAVPAAVDAAQRMVQDRPVYCLDELISTRPYTSAGQPGLSVDPVALIYTSGSTAMPKAVVSNHRQVLFAASAIQRRLGYRGDDSVFCCLPLCFDYGLYQAFLCCLAGARLVLAGAEDAGPALVGRLREQRATVLPAVPSLAAALARLLGRSTQRSDTLRMITNTGAALSPATCVRLREQLDGLAVVPMFGLTECKRVSIEAPNADLVRPGSVGRALPDTEVWVVDPDGRRLPAGEVGELVVRGPHVMCGYWRAPRLTRQRFRRDRFGQPLLYTGDSCRLDAAGNIYFVGREDDLYKQGGYRVSATEVEAAAADVPGVLLAAVLPPAGGSAARLYVTGALTRQELVDGLAARLEPARMPGELHVVAAIPLTVNGKIDKRVLGEAAAPAETAPAGGARVSVR